MHKQTYAFGRRHPCPVRSVAFVGDDKLVTAGGGEWVRSGESTREQMNWLVSHRASDILEL